jgi:DNA adenine methylase
MTRPEPFLRWAGGKRQLLPLLLGAFPADFDLTRHRYFEPFVGGGALTWALASSAAGQSLKPTKRKTGRPLVLNDVNDDLINVYRAVQGDVASLTARLTVLEVDTSEAAYYAARAATPSDPIERAARTIFLNKLSFNGLHRVNAKGAFNVPYGKAAKDSIYSAENLRACSAWLSRAEIRSGGYTTAVADAKSGDVVYFDPPYIPLTVTSNFSKYAKDDFLEMDQWALAGVVRGLIDRGVRVIFSNSNTDLTRRIFDEHLNLYAVSATRSIGASSSTRKRVEEVLGTSYAPSLASDPAMLVAQRRLGAVAKRPPTKQRR